MMHSSNPAIRQNSCDSTAGETSTNEGEQGASKGEESLGSLIEETRKNLNGEDVTIGELLDSIQNRGFGPILLVPALISISPLGTIPGMSAVTGSLIFVVAVQMLFRSDHPWTPKALESVRIRRERFDRTVDKLSPWITWIDRWIGRRWKFMSTGPMHYVIAIVMILLSLTYYPLAVVPFGVLLPGVAMVFFSLGITVRDGYLISFGLVATCGSIYGMIAYWPF